MEAGYESSKVVKRESNGENIRERKRGSSEIEGGRCGVPGVQERDKRNRGRGERNYISQRLGQVPHATRGVIRVEVGELGREDEVLEDGLPKSYQIINENFTTVPVNLEDNEYYLDASFRRLYISVE